MVLTLWPQDLWYESWNYSDYLTSLRLATEEVRDCPEKQIFFLCSHPPCLTMGRGDRQNAHLGLTSQSEKLKTYSIKRGGGLTFHAPNQVILYPVMRLGANYGLNQFLDDLQRFFVQKINDFFNFKLEFKRNPLGLWRDDKKVASFGLGLERWITQHGLAFNLQKIPFEALDFKNLTPCGLKSASYSSLENLLERDISKAEREKFLDQITLTLKSRGLK